MFTDRIEAGHLLAKELRKYQDRNVVVLAIPRGGVVVGRQIAKALRTPLGVIYAKKIPTPGQPELASGARLLREEKFGKTPTVSGKNVILVDDGIATGATVKAALKSLRQKKAKKIILAVPVAPKDVVDELTHLADEIIILETPSDFSAVGQFYRSFPQITDAEVLQLLD